MLIPIIVLVVSLFIIYMFILNLMQLWLNMTCFWGRVMYRKLDKQEFDIEYSFKISTTLVAGTVCAIAGLLWSVIKLAMMA
jgi:hypothetical protein